MVVVVVGVVVVVDVVDVVDVVVVVGEAELVVVFSCSLEIQSRRAFFTAGPTQPFVEALSPLTTPVIETVTVSPGVCVMTHVLKVPVLPVAFGLL